MNAKTKKCSGCIYFFKIKSRMCNTYGLCDIRDGRTNSGGTCSLWKGIKYKRINKHLLTKQG